MNTIRNQQHHQAYHDRLTLFRHFEESLLIRRSYFHPITISDRILDLNLGRQTGNSYFLTEFLSGHVPTMRQTPTYMGACTIRRNSHLSPNSDLYLYVVEDIDRVLTGRSPIDYLLIDSSDIIDEDHPIIYHKLLATRQVGHIILL